MSALKKFAIGLAIVIILGGLILFWLLRGNTADLTVDEVSGRDPTLVEGEAESFPTVQIAEPVGWNPGEAPVAAEGLRVQRFAEGLEHPRVMFTMPNGDVLVTLTRAPASDDDGGLRGMIAGWLMGKAGAGGESPDQLVLLRDVDDDGTADARAVLREDDLVSPSGIAWNEGTLYVANHDAVLAFDYAMGDNQVSGEPRKLMDLPPGGGHWMRNLKLSPDGSQLYVAVGSVSNIGDDGMEVEQGRAAIWELDVESGRARQFAVGLRNPNGLDFNPWTGELWTTVNERDMLGSDLVPDYLTNVPVGAQYGWPWFYWGSERDLRVDAPMPRFLGEYTRRPVYALGPHVAALGLAFAGEGNRMGADFGAGAFIARHGSWNRKPPSGYDVVFVRFDERGNPVDTPVPVLTGFLTGEGTTRGRPTWVAFDQLGGLLVTDDTAGIIWRVSRPDAQPLRAIQPLPEERLPSRVPAEGGESSGVNLQDDYMRRTVGPT